MIKKGSRKKGQVTIFVIIAIVLVVAAAAYFILTANFQSGKVSQTFEPVETQFLNCLTQKTQSGINILESKGGYIQDPPFIPGSSYMPYSSQLDFFGIGIPYWRSISGSNLPINQVPTLENMQNQLSDYIQQEIGNCKFDSFTSDGYIINSGTPKVTTTINGNNVNTYLTMELSMRKGNESTVVKTHQVQIDSGIGMLYSDAVKFYNLENQNLILENYSVDILRNYAPVDGFELTCSPKIWDANQVFDTLKNATQDNLFALRNSGNNTDYFDLKVPINSQIRILNSRNWPSMYEVSPADSSVLVAKPIGNQQGLGILGFCYVPYHFVYNIRYPVLVQLTQNGETFQFPLSINIEGNVARDTTESVNVTQPSVDVCNEIAKSNFTINLADSSGKTVDGNISYECFDSTCEIGHTVNGELKGSIPQCVNGKIIVKSDGYKDATDTISTVQGGSATILMSKLYQKEVYVNLENSVGNEKSVLTFTSDNSSESKTLLYPDQKKINLSEGNYEIKVYTYDNSSLKFDATTTHQCVDVPSGILGVFGVTHQECTDIPVPEQNITNVLVSGGSAKVLFSKKDLSKNNKIEIDLGRYKTPQSLQELQIIYTLVDAKSVGVKFV